MTWFKYLLIMSKDEDLRDCAQYAGVSLKTSFYMRHKIMNALANEMNTVKLEGIAEIDETNAYISYSGNFKKQNTNKELPRKSYQRGRKSMKHKYGSSYTDKIQICLLYTSHEQGFSLQGLTYSPITGGEGNIEFLGCFIHRQNVDKDIDIYKVVEEAHSHFKG